MTTTSEEHAFQASGVQKPIFAAASHQHGAQFTGDADLSDIFADYFIGEFDDPLDSIKPSKAVISTNFQQQGLQTTITGPMVATSSTFSLAEKQPITTQPNSLNINLPLGRGIRTAFHVGAVPRITAAVAHQIRVQNNSLAQAPPDAQSDGLTPLHQQHQKQISHLDKKIKIEQDTSIGSLQNNFTNAPATIAQPSGAISSRLGYTIVGGQLAVPQKGNESDLPNSDTKTAVPDGLRQQACNLPVGVGVKIGSLPPRHILTGGAHGGEAMAHRQLTKPGHFSFIQNNLSNNEKLTAQQILERRQRNREHAKRSRVRKKFMLESLQEDVRGLQRENHALRMLVQEKIPQHAQKIIQDCCTDSPLFGDSVKTEEPHAAPLMKSDFSLIQSLTSGQQNFVLSDPRLPDNPIVYASEGFYELTGYTSDQVLGRNCRFLQGPGTDPRSVDIIRTAIAKGSDVTTCILNYKSDGSPFWNQFFVAALRDSDNCIVNYVGVQCCVEADAGTSHLEEKVNSVMPLKGGEENLENQGDIDTTKKQL